MTERQDLRPLSTEDLLPDHDRNRTDDQYRTDEYRDANADTTDATTRDDGYVDPPVDSADGFHDSSADRTDKDRDVVSDEYDEVDVDAENRKTDDTGTHYDDEQPTSLDEEPVVDETTTDDTVVVADEPVQQKPAAVDTDEALALFSADEIDQYRTEWRGLQSDFVDSPRDAVQHADQLVAQVIQSLATTFADHKRSLEGQWSEGEQVETEELRVALRQYRAFFDKLLTV
jgi:hypothetical protein